MEALTQRSLEVWGDMSVTTLLSVRNEAQAMSVAGRSERAAELYQLVLDGRIERLGPKDASKMVAMNSRVVLRMRLGNSAAADPLDETWGKPDEAAWWKAGRPSGAARSRGS